jgi:hypothetical protein
MSTYYYKNRNFFDDVVSILRYSQIVSMDEEYENMSQSYKKQRVSNVIKTSIYGTDFYQDLYYFGSNDPKDNVRMQCTFCILCGNYNEEYLTTPIASNGTCQCLY